MTMRADALIEGDLIYLPGTERQFRVSASNNVTVSLGLATYGHKMAQAALDDGTWKYIGHESDENKEENKVTTREEASTKGQIRKLEKELEKLKISELLRRRKRSLQRRSRTNFMPA